MKTHYPADWPQGLVNIAEVIGPELALLLAEHLGGVASYVPKEPQSCHKLAMIIGLPALRMLSKVYGGTWLEVPRYAAAKNKKVKIRQLLKDGTSFKQTALNTQTTTRYVTMVSREMKTESQQLSLLDM